MSVNLPIVDISPFISWPAQNTDSHAITADVIDGQQLPLDTPRLATPSSSESLTPAQQATVAALRSAVQHPGFFYLVGHGVPSWMTEAMLDLGRAFYLENSAEEKAKIARRRETGAYSRRPEDCDGARGWQDADSRDMNDWHEALDFYAEIPAEKLDLHRAFKDETEGWSGVDGLLEGKNLFPSHPPALRALLPVYVNRLCAVGTAVMRAMGFALNLGDPEYFVKATDDSFWCLRLLGYPPLPAQAATGGLKSTDDDHDEDDGMVGCGAHSDYGCLTMLLTDKTPGTLKVRVAGDDGTREEPEEEHWLDADPLPGAFVVNIGDMVEQWTGGWAKSTVHKVIHTGQDYRISVPFFFEPAKHVVVRRLAEFGGTEADPEVRYWDHLVSKIDGSFFRKRTTW